MPKRNQPMYTLNHNIVVLAEYGIGGHNKYKRLRIVAHELFDAVVVSGAMIVRKNRAVMTSVLGRKLRKDEHVHHKNEDTSDDSPENLELITGDMHNRHHKLGSKHTESSKKKISAGLNEAYQTGRKKPTVPDFTGRLHTADAKLKMSSSKKAAIANSSIKKQIPPVHVGEKNNTAVLMNEDVMDIRNRAAKGESKRTLASEYGVAIQTIYNVVNRANWRHI